MSISINIIIKKEYDQNLVIFTTFTYLFIGPTSVHVVTKNTTDSTYF